MILNTNPILAATIHQLGKVYDAAVNGRQSGGLASARSAHKTAVTTEELLNTAGTSAAVDAALGYQALAQAVHTDVVVPLNRAIKQLEAGRRDTGSETLRQVMLSINELRESLGVVPE